ncbi:uncharacterized protein LOC142168945 [Nicotiana tabacum]|uniref:Uncharacterized protein LOC142168945 n=1 Tax=Nicotiana tabacum TaxID=4097 RepID=A0AC58SMP9_TOBAC
MTPLHVAIPFPQKMKREKIDSQFAKFLEILKHFHINIPFTDALLQMPSYAKFLKEIFSSKRKLEEVFVVILTEKYSAILQNKLPQKLGDPRSFIIPCTLGGMYFEKALCDSGASINLMPFSIFRKLNLDFIVLQMNECPDEPIILGRPLLFTNEFIDDQLTPDSMKQCLAKSGTIQDDDPTIRREAEILVKDSEDQEMQPEEVQPNIDLKILPYHLKYAYLDKEQCPMIISSSLTGEQEKKLIEVLKTHKGAFGGK